MKVWNIFFLCILTACVSPKPVEQKSDPKSDDFQMTYQLNKEELRKAIRSRLPEIRNCYDKTLKYSPHLEGKIVVEFALLANGQVQKCDIKSSTMKSLPVEKCICEKISSVTFSTIIGDTIRIIDYPFVFTPDE